jgi:hypothetical protein
MNEDRDRFVRTIKDVLEQSLDTLDEKHLARLARARQRALATPPRDRFSWLRWSPLPVVATLLLVLLLRPDSEPPAAVDYPWTDIQILSAAETLDFFSEDIQFYQWLLEVVNDEQEGSNDHSSGVVPLSGDCLVRRDAKGPGAAEC